VTSVDSAISAIGLPTIQALVDGGQALCSSVLWGPDVERQLRIASRHAAATAWLVRLIASPANRPSAQAAALLQDVGRFVWLAGLVGDGDTAAEVTMSPSPDVPHRDVGVELLHLWGLPAPIIAAVAERDTEHRPPSSGLGVSAAVRTAHLLIQQTDSGDPAEGVHDDELALLLSHPQMMTATGTDWRAAAEQASERAGQWVR
jgi:HD-like signal output (HDOD) protein